MENSENKKDSVSQSTVMGILAYLGPLVLVPFFTAKDDQFVKFHVKQGFVLLVIEAAMWVFGMMMWRLWFVMDIVNIATLVLSVIGIVNVVQKKTQKLPLVGDFSRYINF